MQFLLWIDSNHSLLISRDYKDYISNYTLAYRYPTSSSITYLLFNDHKIIGFLFSIALLGLLLYACCNSQILIYHNSKSKFISFLLFSLSIVVFAFWYVSPQTEIYRATYLLLFVYCFFSLGSARGISSKLLLYASICLLLLLFALAHKNSLIYIICFSGLCLLPILINFVKSLISNRFKSKDIPFVTSLAVALTVVIFSNGGLQIFSQLYSRTLHSIEFLQRSSSSYAADSRLFRSFDETLAVLGISASLFVLSKLVVIKLNTIAINKKMMFPDLSPSQKTLTNTVFLVFMVINFFSTFNYVQFLRHSSILLPSYLYSLAHIISHEKKDNS